MVLIGDGLLASLLTKWTFLISCIIINVVWGYNNRTTIMNSKCVYSHSFKDQVYTVIFLTFFSFAVVIIQIDITYSLCMILFEKESQIAKTNYTNLLCTLSASFSIIIFRLAAELLNKNGKRLANRFIHSRLGLKEDNSEDSKK